MIRLSSHWPVPAGRQSKNSLLRTCCSSKPATPLFHAGQHAGRRLYRWPLPVSADLRRRSRLPEARVAQLVEQRIENPRVGGSNPPPGTIPYIRSFLLLIGVYGAIATFLAIFSQKSSDIFGALIIIPILGQMLHFYLDGLVWRFRDPTIRERNHRFLVS